LYTKASRRNHKKILQSYSNKINIFHDYLHDNYKRSQKRIEVLCLSVRQMITNCHILYLVQIRDVIECIISVPIDTPDYNICNLVHAVRIIIKD